MFNVPIPVPTPPQTKLSSEALVPSHLPKTLATVSFKAPPGAIASRQLYIPPPPRVWCVSALATMVPPPNNVDGSAEAELVAAAKIKVQANILNPRKSTTERVSARNQWVNHF